MTCTCANCRRRDRERFAAIILRSFTEEDSERIAHEVLREFPARTVAHFVGADNKEES